MLSLVLMGVFLGLIVLFGVAGPQILDIVMGALGGEQGLYFYLVQLPLADSTQGTLGPAIINVFTMLRNVSLVFFAIALVVAGMCYAFESFRVMREGTAAHILTSGFFTLLMLFAAIPLYNAAASLINYITAPASGLILNVGMIQKVFETTVHPNYSSPGEAVVGFFLTLFFFIISVVSLIAVGVLGTLRLFFLGALVGMLPILLVLRLIPLTKGVSESLLEMLIGLVLSSLIASIFLRFGFEVVNQWAGLAALLAAFATIVATAMMPTILAPKVGGLFMTSAGVTTAAVATAAGATAVIGAGAMAGGASLATTALRATPAAAEGLGGRILGYARLATPAMLRGMADGGLAGLKTAFTRGVPTTRGLGGVVLPSPARVVSRGALAGRESVVDIAGQLSAERGWASTNALLTHFTQLPVEGESERGGRELMERVGRMSHREAGEHFARMLHLRVPKEAYEEIGRNAKENIARFTANPTLADRIALHARRFYEEPTEYGDFSAILASQPENEVELKKALREAPYDLTPETVTLEKLRNAFSNPEAKAIMYSLAVSQPPKPVDEYAVKGALRWTKWFERRGDAERGEYIAERLGIKVDRAEAKHLGQEAMRVVHLLRSNPALLASFKANLDGWASGTRMPVEELYKGQERRLERLISETKPASTLGELFNSIEVAKPSIAENRTEPRDLPMASQEETLQLPKAKKEKRRKYVLNDPEDLKRLEEDLKKMSS